MKLSTRARYGTRALLDLALYGGEEPVPLRSIAQRQEISLPYLEHLLAPLIVSGIVRSLRGPQGGIRLARPPREVKLSEVVGLLEGSTAPVACVGDPGACPRSDHCAAHDLWAELREAMNGVLESTTLQDLVERQRGKERPKEAMYYI